MASRIFIFFSFLSTFLIHYGYETGDDFYYSIYVLLFRALFDGRIQWFYSIFIVTIFVAYISLIISLFKNSLLFFILYLIVFCAGLVYVSNLGFFAPQIYFDFYFYLFVTINAVTLLSLDAHRRLVLLFLHKKDRGLQNNDK